MSTSRRDFLKSAVALTVAMAIPVGLTTATQTVSPSVPELANSTGKFSTGFSELDEALDGGFTPGTLNTFMGVAGCGKLNFADSIAKKYHHLARHELNRGPFDPFIGFDYFVLSRKPIPQSVAEEFDRRAVTLSKLRNPKPLGIEFYHGRMSFVEHLRSTVADNGRCDWLDPNRKDSDSIAFAVIQAPRSYWNDADERAQAGPRVFSFLSSVVIRVNDLGYSKDLRFRNHSLQIQKNRMGRRGEVTIARDLNDAQRHTLANASTGLRNLLI